MTSEPAEAVHAPVQESVGAILKSAPNQLRVEDLGFRV